MRCSQRQAWDDPSARTLADRRRLGRGLDAADHAGEGGAPNSADRVRRGRARAADEVLAGDATDPARLALEGGWGRRVPVPAMMPVLAAIRLDPGEKAALAVALAAPGAWVLMDDRKGRTAAQRLGVPVIGTVGVALRAKAEGRIPSARAVVQAIRAAGFYADDAALARALTGVGETWP